MDTHMPIPPPPTTSLLQKKIILGLTGSIACYKAAELVRLLCKKGATVQVVMTESAQAFITPLTLQALSGQPVKTALLNPEQEASMDHIHLARSADLILIAPASAHCLAKLAHGLADDLLSTLCLATTAPIALAPAMNQQMWKNPITQKNKDFLSAKGLHLWGPESGLQACGDDGPGRMLEPIVLLQAVEQLFNQERILAGACIIITAGPTHEAIDPVRYITNHSTGLMGYALAEAASLAGANVTLISGPTHLPIPSRVSFYPVTSAQEMLDQVMTCIQDCDIFISAAAVTDFRPEMPSKQKIKKFTKQTHLELQLATNTDIVASVAALKNRPFTVGFAAETQALEENAKKKLLDKQLDMIAANWIDQANQGFASPNNALTVFWKTGKQNFSLRPKSLLAKDLLLLIKQCWQNTLQ